MRMMGSPKKLFVANWKMHGDTAMLADWAERFVPPVSGQTVVCPPFPYIAAARAILPKQVAVGAQNVAAAATGAHTGEVSAYMLAESGCQYVIVGHSERRAQGETDAQCAAKLAAAVAAGLAPILCVGESAAERNAGQTAAVVERQLMALTAAANDDVWRLAAVAYEPVWAIGSGQTPSSTSLAAVQKNIRRQLIAQTSAFGGTMAVLYGGSVKSENARMLGDAGMDGGLIGGASLDAAMFAGICRNSGLVKL